MNKTEEARPPRSGSRRIRLDLHQSIHDRGKKYYLNRSGQEVQRILTTGGRRSSSFLDKMINEAWFREWSLSLSHFQSFDLDFHLLSSFFTLTPPLSEEKSNWGEAGFKVYHQVEQEEKGDYGLKEGPLPSLLRGVMMDWPVSAGRLE